MSTDADLSEDFRSMRAQDQNWSGPKLISVGVVVLGIALAIIYALASAAER